MLTFFLALAIFLMAAFDARITVRRIEAYGVRVEANDFMRWLSTRMGPELAALVAIMLPNAILISILSVLGWNLFLSGLVGFKLRYFYNQMLSLRFEREAKKIANMINSRPGSCPPSTRNDSGESSPPAGPPFHG